MRRLTTNVALMALAMTWLGSSARADEPAPAPRPVPGLQPPVVVIAPSPYQGFYRESAYDKWNLYGVDRYGMWRPRVINAPYGNAYYLYNGQPYYYMPIEQINVMPYVANGAVFK